MKNGSVGGASMRIVAVRTIVVLVMPVCSTGSHEKVNDICTFTGWPTAVLGSLMQTWSALRHRPSAVGELWTVCL